MKVGDIMNRVPVSVQTGQTFGEAIAIVQSTRTALLPVVDSEGVYQGVFDLKDVWRALLPKATQLNRKSLPDLSYVSSSLDKLREHWAEALPLPIDRFVNAEDAPPVYPDSPLMQAALLFNVHGESIAVVDRETRKLVGVVSAWQVLDALS